MLGINAAPDTINCLTVKADTELLSHNDLTPGSGNARKVINKATLGDTASVVSQTGFSGRAQCGLAGDDDFHVKVTADGTSWREASFVAGARGFTGFGTGAPSAPITIDTRAFETLGAGSVGLLVTGTSGAERAEFRSIGALPNAAFQGFGARGTPDAPVSTLDNDRLFAVLGSGHDDTGLVVSLTSRSTCVPTATGRPPIMAPS